MADPRQSIDQLVTGVILPFPQPEEEPDTFRMVVLKSRRNLVAVGKVYIIKREGLKLVVVPEPPPVARA